MCRLNIFFQIEREGEIPYEPNLELPSSVINIQKLYIQLFALCFYWMNEMIFSSFFSLSSKSCRAHKETFLVLVYDSEDLFNFPLFYNCTL